ncbi:MAG: hypothetical protein L0H74_07325 [Brachybacterium sp.]|nr:hypothetical protein [Brachybacterium sp.]MDN5899861.1 hypothetical protein [Brachybacterium sp.]
MALTPLDTAQSQAVSALVTARRLEQVPVDLQRAELFLEKARRRLDDLGNLTWAESRYNLTYDAAHDVGEALLAAYGYRTTNGPGQHEALGRFLKAVLTTPPGQSGARRFDQMRRSRNQQRYEARSVGEADADVASTAARALYDGAAARGV